MKKRFLKLLKNLEDGEVFKRRPKFVGSAEIAAMFMKEKMRWIPVRLVYILNRFSKSKRKVIDVH